MELLDEELASALLQDALAFIDAYEDGGVRQHTEASSALSMAPAPAKKQRKKAKPCSLQEARRRGDYKAELDWLRHDVAAMEATLVQLKQGNDARCFGPPRLSTSSVSDASSLCVVQVSAWKLVAVRQLQRRHASELKNRNLRKLLAKQLKVAKVLQALILKTAMERETAMLGNPSASVFASPSAVAKDDEQVYSSLLVRLQQRYSHIDSCLTSTSLARSEPRAMTTQLKLDHKNNMLLETTASVPLPLTLSRTDALVWNDVFLQAGTASSMSSELSKNAVIKNTESFLTCLGHKYELHSRVVMHRFQEPHRVVYAWSSTALVRNAGQRFHEDGLMVLESTPLTMFKTWRCMSVEESALPSSRSGQQKISEEIWLEALGAAMTSTHRRLENFLLDSAVERDGPKAQWYCDPC